MLGQENFLKAVEAALQVALCLRDFPSQLVERDNKPYVELAGCSAAIEPLVLKPIFIARNRSHRVLIESSINSCRVRARLR